MRRFTRLAEKTAHSALSAHEVHILFSGAGGVLPSRHTAPPSSPPAADVARGRRGWKYGTITGDRRASHAALAVCGGYDPACLGNPLEEIRVRPGADEVQLLAIDLVNQQPIWLDVAVAKMFPVAAERVVLISRRQWTATRPSIQFA